LQISEAEYLNFDALRQTTQCLGRIIRSKKDYGLMVLADARYSRADIRSKLPRWIQNFLKSGGLGTFSLGPGSNDIAPVTGGGINTSLSIDAAIGQVKGFLLSMATPHDIRFDYGTVLLNQVQAHQHLADLE
jgi:DNA excision repair protein ERCC-2